MTEFVFLTPEDEENLKLTENYYALYEKLLELEKAVDFGLSISEYLSCRLGILEPPCKVPTRYQPQDFKSIVNKLRESNLIERESLPTEERKQEGDDEDPSLFGAQFSFETEKERKETLNTKANLETVNFSVTTRSKSLKQKVMELDSIVVRLNQKMIRINSINLVLYKRYRKMEAGSDSDSFIDSMSSIKP